MEWSFFLFFGFARHRILAINWTLLSFLYHVIYVLFLFLCMFSNNRRLQIVRYQTLHANGKPKIILLLPFQWAIYPRMRKFNSEKIMEQSEENLVADTNQSIGIPKAEWQHPWMWNEEIQRHIIMRHLLLEQQIRTWTIFILHVWRTVAREISCDK